MNRFIQFHFLTVYPPSNPNRDDQGRPKVARYGGVDRLRISSQSIKRAVRMSDLMQVKMDGKLGNRTRRIGEKIKETLMREEGFADVEAEEWAELLTGIFGKPNSKNKMRTMALAFVSPDEIKRAIQFAKDYKDSSHKEEWKEIEEEKGRKKLKKFLKDNKLSILDEADNAVDIAMFGRMLADDPSYNREAAVQISHALTTHRAMVEDDYYTAVDDLQKPEEDPGAGFVHEAGFGSGVYYLYVAVDTQLLLENLCHDRELTTESIKVLVEALATSSPSGKRNSFAHHTRANFILAETGNRQPRSLAGAFLAPVRGGNLLEDSIDILRDTREKLDQAYGPCAEHAVEMNVAGGKGTLADIQEFVRRGMNND